MGNQLHKATNAPPAAAFKVSSLSQVLILFIYLYMLLAVMSATSIPVIYVLSCHYFAYLFLKPRLSVHLGCLPW